MAYAAAISLKSTIERLVTSPRVTIVPESYRAYFANTSNYMMPLLQHLLRGLEKNSHAVNMERVNALDGQIRDAVSEFEHVLDSHVTSQFLSQSDQEEENQHPLLLFSIDLYELQHSNNSFIRLLEVLMKAYAHELKNPTSSEEEEEDDDDDDDDYYRHVCSSRIDFGGNNESEMVGLSDRFWAFRNRITKVCVPETMTITLIGMAGIGKTALAKKLLQDPLILSYFEIRVFVTIGPQYKLERVLSDILRQVKNSDVDYDNMIVLMGEEGKLAALKGLIIQGLEDRRYLVVVDDLWHMKLWYRHLAELFIWRRDSRVILTTRIRDVANISDWGCDYFMRFMDKKESWDLLSHKVFGEMPCPPHLEKAGKKIADNCAGLPLTIVTVANILSKAEKTTEYWNEVADDKQHSVFTDAYDQMSNVLYPSYDYLPQHLKPCFLYMGVFPQNDENPLPQLVDLWFAEDFIELGISSYKILDDIASRSLVVMKTGTLHPSFWHLCNKEASKSKFFHALDKHVDALTEGINRQRRLCIRNNVLFGIKNVYDSLASISTVRSLLCTGPYHQYPVPLCLENSGLLRILCALTIRFYEFPIEVVVKLVQLRYLSLTCDGDLPPSISKFWNLEHLIVHRHLSIVKSSANSSYLPMEIWNMQELINLQIMGSNLPHPRGGSLLPKLLRLSDVGPQSCTKEVFERTPYLETLEIRIELAPNATHEPLRFFDHISHLHKLQKLGCVIVNPVLTTEVPTPLPIFPSSLVELTLSGLGYPWKEMSKISSLPNLTTLRMQCYAFRGPKWQVNENEFRQLQGLLIEDTDLVLGHSEIISV